MDVNDLEQVGRDLERDFPDLEYWVMCGFTGDPKKASMPIEVHVVLLDVCRHGESQKLCDALEYHLPRWTADPSHKYVLHWSAWLPQSPGLVPICDKDVVRISYQAAKKHGLSGLVFASLGGDSHDPTKYKLDGFQTRPELMGEVRAIGREMGIRTGSVSNSPRRAQISLRNSQAKEKPFVAPSKPNKDTPSLAIPPFKAAQAKQHQQAWADYLGVPVESENSIGMKMVLIPPGEFLMGSSEEEQARFLDEAKADNDHWAIERIPNEGPRHPVRITQPFLLSRHEVTLGQFRLFVEETGYETDAERDGKGGWGSDGNWGKWVQNPRFVWNLDPGFERTDEHPVVNISWNDATAFCRWLSKKTGGVYALPTEAQWEYACRAGTTTAWHCGDDDDLLREYAWFIANAGGKTHRVGQLKPNGWNLYGMHANVREWCADRWSQDYYHYVQSPSNDPTGPTSGSHRVFRGGHWLDYAACCRSAYRDHYPPVICGNHLGFRPAQAIPTGRPASGMSPLIGTAGELRRNLLDGLDLQSHAIHGHWQSSENNVLTALYEKHALLEIPWQPVDVYSLEIVITPRAANPEINIGLVAGGRQFMLVLNGVRGISGLDAIDGRKYRENETACTTPVLKEQRVNTVRCDVGPDSVIVKCNGKAVISYRGDMSRLSLRDEWKISDPSSLFIGAYGGKPFEVHKLELIQTPSGK